MGAYIKNRPRHGAQSAGGGGGAQQGRRPVHSKQCWTGPQAVPWHQLAIQYGCMDLLQWLDPQVRRRVPATGHMAATTRHGPNCSSVSRARPPSRPPSATGMSSILEKEGQTKSERKDGQGDRHRTGHDGIDRWRTGSCRVGLGWAVGCYQLACGHSARRFPSGGRASSPKRYLVEYY